jgi:hypothetical protein
MNNEALEVANTILAQLGGASRLSAMCGCKDFTGGARVLQFKVGTNAKKVSMCRIELDDNDTYTVRFYAGRSFRTLRPLYECSDVYADMLRPLFESQTGMYLSL